jgi:hypothetical protein
MTVQILKDNYSFVFPEHKERSEAIECFKEIALDVGGGYGLIIYDHDQNEGGWVDPSGMVFKEHIAAFNVSGNFTNEDSQLIENEFKQILKDMGQHSSFFSKNGVAHIERL